MRGSNGDLSECEARFAARGRTCRVLALTASTNDDARTWAHEGAPSGAIVIADAQGKGRGRQGRAWSSPAGETLAFSMIVRPPVQPASLPPIAIVAGLATRETTARRVAGAKVKWPNDVVIGARKIAGVLVEGAIAGGRVEHVVIGIGINVARRTLPPEIASIATSLAIEGVEGSEDLDRTTLALDLADALDREIARWLARPDGLGETLSPWDALRGRAVTLEGGVRGIADGIASDGRLRVLRDDGALVHAFSGEVRLDFAT